MTLRTLILILLTTSAVLSQEIDSSGIVNPFSNKPAIADSILADTLAVDSAMIADSLKKDSDIDAVVFAQASDSLSFDVTGKKMLVYGNGSIKYKKSELESGKILANFVTNELEAEGIKDTSDTTGTKLAQTPVLTEGSQQYEGKRLRYNFKTQRGFISLARNNEETQSYRGNKVKKVAKDTYFIEDGIYTTCDADTPHTHFSALRMKVIQNDKIFAHWIFMHIANIPLPIPIPFGVFPNESGRRSGIIVPTFGTDNFRGQYFRNFGYYFALSDYYDATLKGSYYMRGGYGTELSARYKKRYDFEGNLFFSYENKKVGSEYDTEEYYSRDYELRVKHNQRFNPTSSLAVNLTFATGSNYRNTSTDYEQIYKQNITSNATFSKRFEELGANLTVNYSRNQDLQSGDIRETLPSVSFNLNTFKPFQGKNTDPRNMEWYEYISMSYNNRLRNTRDKIDGNLKIKNGFQQNLSMSASPKIGYVSISPSVNYTESWNPQYTTKQMMKFETVDSNNNIVPYDSLVTNKVDAITAARTFNLSVGASTKIYGMWQPQAFGIEAFRHTLSPSVSYNYRPDFSDPFWGYYNEYVDADGNIVEYSKYEDELYNSVSSGENQSIRFSLGNIFEMKTMKSKTDTSDTEDKIRLLTLDAGVSYNFASDFRKLSDLSVSYNTQIGQKLNLRASTRYTFYNTVEGTQLNEYLSETGRGLLRITNFTFYLSTTLAGSEDKDETRTGVDERIPDDDEGSLAPEENVEEEYYYNGQNIRPNFSIPWNLSLSYNYSLGMTDPREQYHSERQNVSLNASLNLTKNWNFKVSSGFDFVNHEVTAPALTIYRDLHCWEMNMTWNPLGAYRGFRFNLRLKASQLRDLKVEKNSGRFTGR